MINNVHEEAFLTSSDPTEGYYSESKNIYFLNLKETDPFERGKEHGQALSYQIKMVYNRVFLYLRSHPDYQNRKKFNYDSVPNEILQELKGLAAGAGYSLEDVFQVHTFLDVNVGEFGCSAMAIKTTNCWQKRIVAANHSVDSPETAVLGSVYRRDNLLRTPIKKGEEYRALEVSNVQGTIQSIVFDTKNKEIQLSARKHYAASGVFQSFSSESLFGKTPTEKSDGQVHLMRNLDWPWEDLGEGTIVLGRQINETRKVISVTFPGYIGTLSGMSNDGFALSECSNGKENNVKGTPCPLLFTHLLDTCSDVKSAMAILNRNVHGSDMNLVIADPHSAKSLELKCSKGGSSVKEVGSID